MSSDIVHPLGMPLFMLKVFCMCLYSYQFIMRSITMCRYVASELATDTILIVGDVKFYLHKVQYSLAE